MQRLHSVRPLDTDCTGAGRPATECAYVHIQVSKGVSIYRIHAQQVVADQNALEATMPPLAQQTSNRSSDGLCLRFQRKGGA